jgi:hypothetical protein
MHVWTSEALQNSECAGFAQVTFYVLRAGALAVTQISVRSKVSLPKPERHVAVLNY